MRAKLLVLIAAILALPAFLGAAPAAAQQKRVALVIGNSAYQNVAKLANPARDSAAIAKMFKDVGFNSVTIRQDLGVVDFKRALRDFADAAQDADVAVVYYAGHGIQVGDMNYMIPVDARLATEIDAQDEAVSLDRILMTLQSAKRLRLVLLDACRDNPFLSRMKVSSATRAVTRGLARVEPENNSLVAYAAKNGQIARDGTGEHSPFTAALLKHMPVPGLDVRLALGRVRDDVLESTGNRQEPFVYGSLGGDAVSLAPVTAAPKLEAAASSVKEDYTLAERIGTKQAWEAFLASHKDGLYAELARAQLAKLMPVESRPAASSESSKPQAAAPATPVLTPSPKPSTAVSNDRADWELIKTSSDAARLRDFIARYPSSPFAEMAKGRLAGLERAAREREEKARAEQQAALRAEQQAAAARSEQQAAAKPAEESEACSRDRQKLEMLRPHASQGWAQEDLKRLAQTTSCERIRAEAIAAPDLPQRTITVQPSSQQPAAQQAIQQQAALPQEASGSDLSAVVSAMAELRKLGCVAGGKDPAVNGALMSAVRSYLAQKGRSPDDIKVVEALIADLKAENDRLCAANANQANANQTTKPGEPAAAKTIEGQRGATKDEHRRATKPKAKQQRQRSDRTTPYPAPGMTSYPHPGMTSYPHPGMTSFPAGAQSYGVPQQIVPYRYSTMSAGGVGR
ncbi:MAG TPA: caspase family protein [Xanthobacteraceae bacterium]|nr:caspase family protein [Xanthobacteraceae bacterium]